MRRPRRLPYYALLLGACIVVAGLWRLPPALGQIQFGPDILANPPGGIWACMSVISGGQRNIAAVGDTVFAVWDECGVYFARSFDGGKTFQPPVRVADPGQIGGCPCLAVSSDGSLVYVAWMDGRHYPLATIYFDRSTDGGATFAVDQRLSAGNGLNPALATDGAGAIYVVWEGGFDLYMASSADSGNTFSDDFALDLPSYDCPAYPALAIAPDGRLVLAYMGMTPSYETLEVTHSYDGGLSFAHPTRVVPEGPGPPSVAVDGIGRIHVAYDYLFHSTVHPDTFEVRHVLSEPGTLTFSGPHRIGTLGSGYDATCSVAVTPEKVFVVWGQSFTQVGFAWGPNPPTQFSPPLMVNDPGAVEVLGASVAASSEGLPCVLWASSRPEGAHIFFDKGRLVTNVAADPVSVAGTADSEVLPSLSAGPNPVHSAAVLRYRVPDDMSGMPVALAIYDTAGRRVKSWVAGRSERGIREVLWNAADDAGRPVAPGVYLARLEIGGHTNALKILVSR